MQFVDDKIRSIDKCTFRVEATGSFSTIDHFAVSDKHVHDVKVYDSGINLSDHCPLILTSCYLWHLMRVVHRTRDLHLRVVMY